MSEFFTLGAMGAKQLQKPKWPTYCETPCSVHYYAKLCFISEKATSDNLDKTKVGEVRKETGDNTGVAYDCPRPGAKEVPVPQSKSY